MAVFYRHVPETFHDRGGQYRYDALGGNDTAIFSSS